MADERDEWLDMDAAERLLRGEPVSPVGDQARARAARLSAALDGAARAAEPVNAELPGETAALMAFRRAAGAGAGTGTTDSVSTVRMGHRAAPAPSRWGRPVRFGLAAALAGVTIGGVAVAAGSGVLPGPFGRNADPAPAASVSAAATAPPSTPEAPTGTPGPAETSPGATGTPDGGDETPGRGNGDGDSGGTPASSTGPSAGAPTTDPGQTGEASQGTGNGGAGSGTWARTMAQACQDYRAGRLTPESKRRLEVAAGGAERVERFCARLLDRPDRADDDGKGGGSEDRGGNGGGDDGGDDGGGGQRDDDGGDDRSGDGGGDDGDGLGDAKPAGSAGSQGAPGGFDRPVPPLSFTRQPPPA
ncbi:hypothetical protein [Streptomyces hypolithicus]